jgi:predicted ATPase
MKIESIKLRNFKTFRELNISHLPEMAIFVGANGVGKSTLFDVFGFLSDALKNNVRQALQKRGGFKEVISREQGGLIEIELQFRLMIAEKERLVTYKLAIGEDHGKPVVEREILRYKRSSYGSPFHFLDFSRGKGYAIKNEEDFDKKDEDLERDEDQQLGAPDILAIKGLGQFDKFKAANAFRDFIENWHVSDFHIEEARPSREAAYAEHLSATGENLSAVAQYMFENHKKQFDEMSATLGDKMRVSNIDDYIQTILASCVKSSEQMQKLGSKLNDMFEKLGGLGNMNLGDLDLESILNPRAEPQNEKKPEQNKPNNLKN